MPVRAERDLEAAKKYLLRLLRYRPRSRREAEQRLKRAGFDLKIVSDVLSYAESCDLIDDEKFAKLWVSDRMARKPKSRRALGAELREKGIADEIIAKAVAEVCPDERALIRQLAQERWQRLGEEDSKGRYRKTAAYLCRRGFSMSDAQEVLAELMRAQLKCYSERSEEQASRILEA